MEINRLKRLQSYEVLYMYNIWSSIQRKQKKTPHSCLICIDGLQYVNPNGQEWTTLEEMKSNKIIRMKLHGKG